MSTSQFKINRFLGATPSPRVSDERYQATLENIFGVKVPVALRFESDEEQRFAGVLENVWGIRLPSEMVTRAYSIFIKEYETEH